MILRGSDKMKTSTLIITIISAVLGTGGLSTLLNCLINAKKFKADARRTDEETDSIRRQSRISEMDFINSKLQEISKDARIESMDLRKRNDDLSLKINALNAQLQALMNWIISDNQKHRMWLENEIHKLNPDIEIPVCPNPPQIFITDHPTSTPNTNESPPQN